MGISFKTNNYDKIYRAKLSLKNDKIYQSLNFDRKLFDFDSFYLAQNQFFVLEQPTRKFTGSFSYYHLAVNNYYQSNGLRVPSSDNVIRAYYQTYCIPSRKKFVICTEDEFQMLDDREKATISFVIGSTKTYIRPTIVYVAKRNIRGLIADSILKNANYIRTIKLTDQIINQIKADQFPDFALTEFEQFMIPLKNPNAPLLERLLSRNRPNMWKEGQWRKTDLHYYPFYLWPENNFCYVESEENRYNLLFNTSKKILNGEVIKPITKTKHTALKTLLSKNVLEIKKLVDKIGSSNEFKSPL